jgi:hypothetical protein
VNKPSSPVVLVNIEAFLKRTHGQIIIGEIPPIRCVALAADALKPARHAWCARAHAR